MVTKKISWFLALLMVINCTSMTLANTNPVQENTQKNIIGKMGSFAGKIGTYAIQLLNAHPYIFTPLTIELLQARTKDKFKIKDRNDLAAYACVTLLGGTLYWAATYVLMKTFNIEPLYSKN